MKRIFLFLLFLRSFLSFGQNSDLKNNSLYFELLGNGASFFSINYEHVFHYKKLELLHNAIRIGFTSSTNRYDKSSIYNIPMELNTLIGKHNNFIEIGFGLTEFIGTSDLNNPLIPWYAKNNYYNTLFLRLGWRILVDDAVIRIAPLLGYTDEKELSPKRICRVGFGISCGWIFNFRKTTSNSSEKLNDYDTIK